MSISTPKVAPRPLPRLASADSAPPRVAVRGWPVGLRRSARSAAQRAQGPRARSARRGGWPTAAPAHASSLHGARPPPSITTLGRKSYTKDIVKE